MNILKSIISIQSIMCLRLICGLYYKISSNSFVTVFSKVYCLFASTTIIGINIISVAFYPTDKIRLAFQIFTLTANILVNTFCNSENFPTLLNKLREINNELGDQKVRDEIPVSRILLIVALGIRLSTHVTFCSTNPEPCFYTVLALDLMLIMMHFTKIMMFELLWHKMRLIRKRFEKESTVSRWDEDQQRTVQRIRKYLKVYRNLLKTTELTNATMKPLIMLTVVTAIPKYLNLFYSAVFFGLMFSYNTTTILEVVTEFAVAMAPAAVAELINNETDKLKLCFGKQMLFCKDETTRCAIEDAMMYFRQNPFKYTVWRLFTLNLSMILSVVTLLTTYTVAMVQFAHFYD